MSGDIDSSKDSNSKKFVKLSFTELCDSKLSGIPPFDNKAKIHCVKKIKDIG